MKDNYLERIFHKPSEKIHPPTNHKLDILMVQTPHDSLAAPIIELPPGA